MDPPVNAPRPSRRARAAVLSVLAAAMLVLSAAAARADVTVRFQPGWDGRWVVESPTPVVVELRNTGSERVALEIALRSSSGFSSATSVHRRVVPVEPGAARREVFLVQGPQAGAVMTASLAARPAVPIHHGSTNFSRGQATIEVIGDAQRAGGCQPSGRVIGVIGGSAAPIDGFDIVARAGPGARGAVAALRLDPSVVALGSVALMPFETIVIASADPVPFEGSRFREALLDWTALGGRLVFAAGADTPALAGSAAGPWLPADIRRAGKHKYAGWIAAEERRMRVGKPPKRPPPKTLEAEVLRLVPRAGAEPSPTSIDEGLPLLVSRRLGNGHVVVLAYDLVAAATVSRGTTSAAAYTEVLLEHLTGRRMQAIEDEDGGFPTWEQRVPLASRLVAALRDEAFQPPPAVLILLALVLYVLAVGPIDYFVLKRLGKRRLTTLTFTASVIGFTVIAYGASFLVFSGGGVTNTVAWFDFADGGRDGRQLVRGARVAGFYSPVQATEDVEYTLPTAVLGTGLPGSDEGGQFGRALPVEVTGSSPTRPEIEVSVAFRSQRNVCTVFSGQTARTVDVSVGEDGAVSVVNGLSIPLHECVVVAEDGTPTHRLANIAPGETATMRRLKGTASVAWMTRRGLARTQWDETLSTNAAELARELAWFVGARAPRSGDTTGSYVHWDVDPARIELLRRLGLCHGDALGRRRSVFVAMATESPFPEDRHDDGTTTVIVVREFETR